MAPRTRATRRRDTSALEPPVAGPSSAGDNLDGNDESRSAKHAVDDAQVNETETPARQMSVRMMGGKILVPESYEPDTYDPDGRMPWTPEPKPYSPETYAAWGRKHFGEEWYQSRKTMLEERNTYVEFDHVYIRRQRALRVLEHRIEGRPFEPGEGWSSYNPQWRRLRSQLSKKLGIPSRPASPSPPGSHCDSELGSGYDTFPPTPTSEPREPTPDDPWERLEWSRRLYSWDEDHYHFERVYLRERLIDEARSRQENELGDMQFREMKRVMESFRYVDPDRFRKERAYLQDHIDLPKEGWTREEIISRHEAEVALDEWQSNNRPPTEDPDFPYERGSRQQKAASRRHSEMFNTALVRFYGSLPPFHTLPPLEWHPRYESVHLLWRKGIHARLSRRLRRDTLFLDTKMDASSRSEALQTIEDEERRDEEALGREIQRAIELKEQDEEKERRRLAEHQQDYPSWGLFLEPHAEPPGLPLAAAAAANVTATSTTPATAAASRPAKDASRKTGGGRITKQTSTRGKASTARQRGRPRKHAASERLRDVDDSNNKNNTRTAPRRPSRQARTQKSERSSRRQAGKAPEHAMM